MVDDYPADIRVWPVVADEVVNAEASDREVLDFDEYVQRTEVHSHIRSLLEEALILSRVARECGARKAVFERDALAGLGLLPGRIRYMTHDA